MMKDEQDSGPLEIYEDTSNSDSYGASFDRSSYVVIRTDLDPHRRHCRTSATNDCCPRQNRRRCGSIGEEQPESQICETSPRADGESTIYTLLGDHNFLMVEPYQSTKPLQAQAAAKFLDGCEFLSRDNVFRGVSKSIQKASTQQKLVKEKESRRVKRSSSHRSAASSSYDVDQIENLFHQLHTRSNATEKQGKTKKQSGRVCVSGGPFMSPRNEQKEDHRAEPTIIPKKVIGDDDDKKRKNAPKKHKKQVKEYTLQPVIPPPKIHVSDNVTVASSIGGLSRFPQPKRPSAQHTTRSEDRHQRPTMSHYVAKQDSSSEIVVSSPTSVAALMGPSSAIQHHKNKASSSRPAPKDGFLPRPPTRQQTKSPNDKVPLESFFQSPREIDVSDPTIVSALTEHIRPAPNRRRQRRARNHS